MSGKYEALFSLKGKVVLSAGGGGAIGGEMARACAEYGAKVGIADLMEEAAAKMVAELRGMGAEATSVGLNVNDPASVAAAVAAVEKDLGPVDVLINTVGTHIEQPAHEVTPEAWDKVVDVNLRGAFLLSQAAARSMIARGVGGSIIHVTSVRSGLGIRRGYAAYCASKGGLAILIKQLATEWAPYGIRVNGIAPTFTRTALVADYLEDPEFYNSLVARIPMGRICETSDLVGIALFYASDASSFITGQNVFVDGGVTASQ
ncbi:MAG: SDR family oxidoreductase [Chloroflexi bacterium]|nr:SDR family oxidoreductase [Chloroflexota bacterium]